MLIDTHAHLDQEEFDADRAEVIARAVAAGVEKILAVGIGADSERGGGAVGGGASVGVRGSWDSAELFAQTKEGDWERVVALANSPKIVAIGETGLDRHWDYSPFELQQDYFDRHLRLSQERKLPFVVHTRESDTDVLAMLREARKRGPLTGVMHSFTGTSATAAECIELGLYISFAGMVTFKKSGDLRAVAESIPVDRILIETDSPYLSPDPLRGKRNEPANLVHTARVLAEVRRTSLEDFARQTVANAQALFQFA